MAVPSTTMAASTGTQSITGESSSSAPCIRCKTNPATHDLRSENVCTSCLVQYIANKAIKRLELLQRETRGSKLPSKPQRYLLALSGGPSSTCLLDVLYDNILQQRARGQRVKFELVVAHVVDDDCGSGAGEDDTMRAFRERFPEVEISSVKLSDVLGLDTIDWASLPSTSPPDDTTMSDSYSGRLAHLFTQLPSATSRADVRRLLTRHLLITTAVRRECDVLLLGYNTTSLAELTLSETAKGRGFALPWVINDGVLPLPRGLVEAQSSGTASAAGGGGDESSNAKTNNNNNNNNNNRSSSSSTTTTGIPIYSPLRDIYRKELLVYLTAGSTLTLTSPPSSSSTTTTAVPKPLSSLIPRNLLPAHLQPAPPGSSSGKPTGSMAVVSHRDLSIDDVMARYFADVEANYPSVVANVVRTTGKLNRLFSSGGGGGGGGGGLGHEHNHNHEHNRAPPAAAAGKDDHGSTVTATATTQTNPAATTATERRDPQSCGICGLQLDEHGNQRWRGEIGDFDARNADVDDNHLGTEDRTTASSSSSAAAATTAGTSATATVQDQQRLQRLRMRQAGRLCYGCERSILG